MSQSLLSLDEGSKVQKRRVRRVKSPTLSEESDSVSRRHHHRRKSSREAKVTMSRESFRGAGGSDDDGESEFNPPSNLPGGLTTFRDVDYNAADTLSESEVAFLRHVSAKARKTGVESSTDASVQTSLRQNDAILLDIGGHVFKTTKSTLTKFPNTFFAALFSGRYSVPRQADGSVFIDRDGTHFRAILNFLRCGTMVWPQQTRERREIMLEASFYGLDGLMVRQTLNEAGEEDQPTQHIRWQSNVIFVGSQNIDSSRDDAIVRALSGVQCPTTSEMVWKSIHDTGLTVVFQIINDENSDFSLAGIGRVLALLERWRRPNLRFVLVYDAELIRELLKLSGEPFNNSSYIWYFARGKLIDCGIQFKLRYVVEQVWKHYYCDF